MPNVFLYGPDTFRKRTFDRIGPCTVLGPARTEDYALSFNKPNMKDQNEGFANLVEASGETLYGVVFELEDKQAETLDGYFGGYQKKTIKVHLRKTNEITEASTYIARRIKPGLKPSAAMLTAAVQGAEENGLPKDFVEKIKGFQAID
jgi:hypothetical protein